MDMTCERDLGDDDFVMNWKRVVRSHNKRTRRRQGKVGRSPIG